MTFPTGPSSGALLESGDYQEAIRRGTNEGGLAELKSRRDAARAEGRLYGIGYTAVVEPSVSNMGYITIVLTPAERRKAGPKNGAQATATVAIDPVGSVTVHVASVPQGQGHRTVLSQVVADVFGLAPADIRVNTEIGHRQGCLVDRLRQLRQPLRRPLSPVPRKSLPSACASGWRASPRPARTPTPRISRLSAARSDASAIPDNSSFLPPGRAEPLVARCAPRGHRPDDPRDRVLEPAGTDRRRTKKTISTLRSATALFSISAASRSIG